MTLQQLLRLYSKNNCNKVYIKRLSPNDNSKNQIYLGGSFEALNILPISDIKSDYSGDWKRMRFKSKVTLYWIIDPEKISPAPYAQLIMYPKYPEVRLSGFLKGCKGAPSEIMAGRRNDRLLFLGISLDGSILAFVASNESDIYAEYQSRNNITRIGIFEELNIINGGIQNNPKAELLKELSRIHSIGWISGKRLDNNNNLVICESSNCGGYTLEAELGIKPNGYSEPDFMGWEIKQFSVRSFDKWNSSVITLFTPEPTSGYYVSGGVEAFIKKYGYKDKKGREKRINFGGIHKYNIRNISTGLKLIVNGFDPEKDKITDTEGYVGLVDDMNHIAAAWSFSSLLRHWNTKHARACYVPSLNRTPDGKDAIVPKRQYLFSSRVLLCEGTDFTMFLKQVVTGNIYYDPGIKLEFEIPGIRPQNIKRRSQFRIKSSHIQNLYRTSDKVDVRDLSGYNQQEVS